MRKLMTTTLSPDTVQPRFHSVAETARILGVSEMTLYRAIRGGQFPAVQLMGRLIIPARVIDDIIDAAIESGVLVDTEDWTPNEGATAVAGRERGDEGRPRPGANQTGAGSPVTQQMVREDGSSMPDDSGEGGIRSGRRRASGGTR
jgi:excisionase family DNA binding protein